MTRDDCARLVNLIASTWPAGVKGHVWTDVLTGLEQPLAHAAYRALRDANERLSVAQFIAQYRSERARETSTGEPPAQCELCDGMGWVQASVVELGNPASYSSVTPCRCTAGNHARNVHARIATANGWPLTSKRDPRALDDAHLFGDRT